MREKFDEVLALQAHYSSQVTPEMARRGHLIRNEIVEELLTWPALSPASVLPYNGQLSCEGSDGKGNKVFVPWVRVFSRDLSPSAQTGWYVVYLFRADGAGVSLCLSHGSTTGVAMQPRSPAEAARLMHWARTLIGPMAVASGMLEGLDLGFSGVLSRAYETTTAFSKFYPANELPTDESLSRELTTAVGLLGEVYRSLELGRAPASTPPEVLAASDATDQVSRPNSAKRNGGQGFGLSAAERAVVEAHAMQLAQAWLQGNGYANIRDVHRTHSCDFMAEKSAVEIYVEVKGTTSGFGSILLTANEVELHLAKHPDNVLIVVHDIDLLPMRTKAIGGTIKAFESWSVDACVLRPLSYQCFLVSDEC